MGQKACHALQQLYKYKNDDQYFYEILILKFKYINIISLLTINIFSLIFGGSGQKLLSGRIGDGAVGGDIQVAQSTRRI